MVKFARKLGNGVGPAARNLQSINNRRESADHSQQQFFGNLWVVETSSYWDVLCKYLKPLQREMRVYDLKCSCSSNAYKV